MFNKLKKSIVLGLTMIMVVGTTVPTVSFAGNPPVQQAGSTGGTTTTESNANSKIPNVQIGTDGQITGGLGSSDKGKILNTVLEEYGGIVTFISGIAMISMIMFFIFNLMALGNSKGNPQERQKAITGLIVTGIATAGLGAVTLIVGLFFNMLN